MDPKTNTPVTCEIYTCRRPPNFAYELDGHNHGLCKQHARCCANTNGAHLCYAPAKYTWGRGFIFCDSHAQSAATVLGWWLADASMLHPIQAGKKPA